MGAAGAFKSRGRFPSFVLAEILGLVAPPICIGCGRETQWSTDALCRECEGGLERLPVDCCRWCAQPRPCLPCPASEAPWEAAISSCGHSGTARAMVRSLKDTGAARVADAMAREMAAALDGAVLRSRAVVPVAPHPARRRDSGVDHALALARALSRLTGRPLCSVLGRDGPIVKQAGAARTERTAPGRFSFTARVPVPLRVLLVDDVHTSGATLAAATATLVEGGCRSVVCLSFARALRSPAHLRGASDW